MPVETATNEIQTLGDPGHAVTLLKAPRTEILARSRAPVSARELGASLGLSRQRVAYHVRALARAGLLWPAGRRKRRALTEQRWVASARAYVLAPEALGPLAADPRRVQDRLGAAYLLAVAARLQSDVARASAAAARKGARMAALTVEADVRFETAEQRAGFAAALRDAVAAVVAAHTSPAFTATGAPGAGEPYRLVLGVHALAEEPCAPSLPPPEPPAAAPEDRR